MAAVDSRSPADASEDGGEAGPGACDAGTVQFEVRSGGGPWWVYGSNDRRLVLR
jgi:hypothetical protein